MSKQVFLGGIYLILGAILGMLALSLLNGTMCAQTRIKALPAASDAAQSGSVKKPASNPIDPARKDILPSAAPLALNFQPGKYTPEEMVNIRVYENSNRSVVNINTRSVRQDWYFSETLAEGEGSGAVLSKDGYILTNFHVISGAREITVTLFNGKTYSALVKGVDPSNDIAVIQIGASPDELFPVTLGNSAELRVGQRIFAIGNPFGLERTLTVGIISSLNRTLPSRVEPRLIKQVIQIDAAINPGNSGGPLMDSRGYMVGMNTAIASKTGQSAGVGFAVPSNTISRVVTQLIKHGKIIVPTIGINKALQTDKGLLIIQMEDDGPAAKAGLRGPKIVVQKRQIGNMIGNFKTLDRSAADIIFSVDGKPIHGADDFLTIIESHKPGDVVKVGVIRDGMKTEVPVTLELSSDDAEIQRQENNEPNWN